MTSIPDNIIIFDGVCNLCNSSVQFIIKRDRRKVFRFVSLQSEFARQFLDKHIDLPENLDSIILVEKEHVHIKSKAILKIFSKLGGLYPLFAFFWIVPRVIRDIIYDLIAKNRYRWFGKKDSCMIPAPELKDRFLDSETPFI